MTTAEIIQHYDIQFSNYNLSGTVEKIVSSNFIGLDLFFSHTSYLPDIQETLLPIIDFCLLGTSLPDGISETDLDYYFGVGEIFRFTNAGLKILHPDTYAELAIIPLVDFKKITLMWQQFLQTSPLDGTSITVQ